MKDVLYTMNILFTLRSACATVICIAFVSKGLAAAQDQRYEVRKRVSLSGASTGPSAFDRDEKIVVNAHGGGAITKWDTVTGKKLESTKGGANEFRAPPITVLALGPDWKTVATNGGANNCVAAMWDVTLGKKITSFQFESSSNGQSGVNELAFSPDGTLLAGACNDRTVRLWSVSTGRELFTLRGHRQKVTCLEFSTDGKHLVSGSYDLTIRLWDIATGKEERVFKGHANVIGGVAISPDGNKLASGSIDGTARLWDVATGKELSTLFSYNKPKRRDSGFGSVGRVAFSPCGKIVAGACSLSVDAFVKQPLTECRLWGVATGMEIANLNIAAVDNPLARGRIYTLLFSQSGKILLTSIPGETILWDVTHK